MSFLKISTILCGFLVLQANAFPQNQGLNGNDIIDTITDVVAYVEKEIDSLLNVTLATLDEAINDTDLLEKNLDEVFGKLYDGIVSVIDGNVEKIKEDGNQDTKALVECLQKEKDDIRTLVVGTFEKNSKCLVAELVKFIKSIRSIVVDIQQVQSDVKKSLAKLDTCPPNNLETLTCAWGIAQEAIEVAKKIPDVTSKDIEALEDILKNFPTSLKSCVKPNADLFRKDIIKVIDEISSCSRK